MNMDRLPAIYRRTHGIRYFHGCYSLGDDQLWGITRTRKGADHSAGRPTARTRPNPQRETTPLGTAHHHPSRLINQPGERSWSPH
ncbi:hypothetical protein [Nonomuraea guangzhouensis]|uniref:hypothetical protein n=1 Tax=Nonomuraea guangzhouensis TaxID=1291555 RepID=UPI001FE658B8